MYNTIIYVCLVHFICNFKSHNKKIFLDTFCFHYGWKEIQGSKEETKNYPSYIQKKINGMKNPTEIQFTNDNLNKNSLQFIEALLSLM